MQSPERVQMVGAMANPEDVLSEIEYNVYLSGYSTALRVTRDRIQTIISILNHPFPEEKKRPGIEYLQITARDTEDQDLLTYFPQACDWIANRVEANKAVLIHCMSGVSRSGIVACAYVMRRQRMNADEAIEMVQRRRHFVMPNLGFVRQLEFFYQMCYTLNANDRHFRGYLIESYLNANECKFPIYKYFERLAVAEAMTPFLAVGPDYSCVICSKVLFKGIHVIRNNVQTKCKYMYVEPQEWMIDQILKRCQNYESHGFIECVNCGNKVAKYQYLLTPFRVECNCAAHKGLQMYCRLKVVANSVSDRAAKSEVSPGKGSVFSNLLHQIIHKVSPKQSESPKSPKSPKSPDHSKTSDIQHIRDLKLEDMSEANAEDKSESKPEEQLKAEVEFELKSVEIATEDKSESDPKDNLK